MDGFQENIEKHESIQIVVEDEIAKIDESPKLIDNMIGRSWM